MGSINLKAVLGPRMPTPDPKRQIPGKGSVVTLIEFYWAPDNYDNFKIEAVRYYDEWGQIGSCRQEEVIVLPK